MDIRQLFPIFNKTEEIKEEEGKGIELDELNLSMSDEELLDLKKEWERKSNKLGKINQRQELNEKYYLGDHKFKEEGGRINVNSLSNNLIFEAIETFLPIATQRNPEPVVISYQGKEGDELATNVRKMLEFQADRVNLKLKLKHLAKNQCIYLLGVLKMGFSEREQDLTCEVIRTQNILLDTDFPINVNGEYEGEYIGEKKKEKASRMILRFPNKKKEIEEEVNGKMGTVITYTEWWTDDYVFWTYKDILLAKAKNPHWNYTKEIEVTDEFGNKVKQQAEGKNHFKIPKKPYVFFLIFNDGKQPFDNTSLIEQVAPLQNLIDKRISQIDKNVDRMNSGVIISGDSGLSQEQSQVAVDNLDAGGALYINSGDPNGVVGKIQGTPLPGDVYNQLIDARNELRGLFGVQGSTAGGTGQEQTVRGKIIIREQDSSRIGGGYSEFLEQVADKVFNWMIQLMFVYYEETHYAGVIGKEKASEVIELSKNDLINDSLFVTVKSGSMIPKDPLTKANQAMDLMSGGFIDVATGLSMMDFPNPKEVAKQKFIENSAPQLLYPDVDQQIKEAQMQQQLDQAATEQAIAGAGQEQSNLINAQTSPEVINQQALQQL